MSKNIPNKSTMKIIKRAFPDKNVTIESENYIRIRTKDGGKCALFSLHPDHIFIDSLSKCDDTSGGDLLTMIDAIAKEMPNVKYIKLLDSSQIKICSKKISLHILKILSTGQSWYNSQGYYSENYKSEKTHNEEIINMDYEKFIDVVYKEHLEKFKYENSIEQNRKLLKLRKEQLSKINKSDNKEQYHFIEEEILEIQDRIINHKKIINRYIQKEEEEINTGIRLFPDVNKTVKDYFSYVLSNMKDDKDCQNKETIEKSIWLSNYIAKIDYLPILKYEGALKKMVVSKRSSKSKSSESESSKSESSKSKSSKSKSSKSNKSNELHKGGKRNRTIKRKKNQ
jgi:hypothetical protein